MNRARSRRLPWVLAVTLAGLAARTTPAADGPPAAPPGPRTPLDEVVFVAFDTETTGFDPVRDRVVEIGAVKFAGDRLVARRSWLVNPGRAIPLWAQRVHGITDEMVADQPPFAAVYPEFTRFIAGAVLLAHNARFDIAFLEAEARRNLLGPPANPVLDSLPVFRAWFPDSTRHSLEGLTRHLGMDDAGLHRAVADAMNLYRILQRGLAAPDRPRTLGGLERAAGGAKRF